MNGRCQHPLPSGKLCQNPISGLSSRCAAGHPATRLRAQESVTSFLQTLKAPEELHPELRERITQTSLLGAIIQHPLVYAVPYAPLLNAQLNKQLAQKQAAVVQARSARKWDLLIWLHERPYRPTVLQEASAEIPDKLFWPLLHDVWIDTENLHTWVHLLKRFIKEHPTQQEQIMSAKERQKLAQMPNILRIYRGHQGHNREGWSWSTNKQQAEWFARRLSASKAGLLEGQVPRAQVLAFFASRGEQEIVVDPSLVETLSDRKL